MSGLASPAVVGCAAALALALGSLGHGFVRDDVPLVVENPLLRAPGGLARLVSSDFLAGLGSSSGLWRPLPLLGFWLEGRLGGWEPLLFHASNALLAGLGALLVGLLLVQAGLPRGAATLATLWFAVMPAHVEPVAWISGRIDLLAGAFALLCLWLDRRARAAGRRSAGWMAPAALAGALLSKESAAGWAGVILVAEWTRAPAGPGRIGGIARWMAPYLAVTAAWWIAHAVIAGPAALPPYVDEALRARRQAAGWLILPQYLSFLWPWFPHASDVPLPLPAEPFAAAVLLGALGTLLAIAGVGVLTLRRSRLAVPAAIVVTPMLPAIGVALARGFLASGERTMYLPSAGAAWLAGEALAAAWARGPRWQRAAGIAAIALVAASAVETVRLVPRWADNEQVFRTVIERHPASAVGWLGLGEEMMRAGRREEAERALAAAAALDQRLPAIDMARAELAYRWGDGPQAIRYAGRALELDPDLAQARLVRASTLLRLGRAAEAGPDVDRLLRDRPGDPDALMLDGQRYLALGDPAAAVAPLAAAARIESGNSGLWAALGSAQAATGDLPGARASLEKAVSLDPGAVVVWRRLAAVCSALGDSAAAGAALERAGGRGAPH